MRYIGQTTDHDGDPITLKVSDGQVWMETILDPEREVIETDLSPAEARELADLLIRAADEADS